MDLLITGIYASWFGLLFFVLTVLVIKGRRAGAVSLGDGQSETLQMTIRAHGNFSEYVPICLILMAVAEMNTPIGAMLHIPGGLLLLGRLLHAYGLIKHVGPSKQRIVGMLLTFAVLVGLSLWNLFIILTR